MLILASSSEWRARVLKDAGFDFTVMPADIDEDRYHQLITDPETLVKTLAEAKAAACIKKLYSHADIPPLGGTEANIIILGADTIIAVESEIIGKPRDRVHAKEIIQKIAGRTHDIWTGVCLLKPESREKQLFTDKSQVTLRPMSSGEIEWYLDTNDWVGKAGGYQIQKSIKNFVTEIDGDPNNIIGLPLRKVIGYLS